MALDEAHRLWVQQASREPASVEQAAGEILVSAYHAAEVLQSEANERAENLLADRREQAREIVAEAERQGEEIDAARVGAEAALAQTQAETRRVREDAERAIAELHAEARRVPLVIEEFRNQWRNLISEALKKLELHVQGHGAREDQATLHDDLRRRLAQGQGEDAVQREGTVDSEIESHGEDGSS